MSSKTINTNIHNEVCSSLLEGINIVEDFRTNNTKIYPLNEILFSALVAIICGTDSWYAVTEVLEILEDRLKKYLPFKNGFPSHDTFNRVFQKLPPESFELLFC